jgi:hypothetical protein
MSLSYLPCGQRQHHLSTTSSRPPLFYLWGFSSSAIHPSAFVRSRHRHKVLTCAYADLIVFGEEGGFWSLTGVRKDPVSIMGTLSRGKLGLDEMCIYFM